MAFSVKSIVKKGKNPKTQKRKQVELDIKAYEDITEFRRKFSNDIQKDHSSDFSKIVRIFFMKFFKIRHHFTHEEFVNDLKRKRIDSELKKEITHFFNELSELEYKQEKHSPVELDALVRVFESIIPRLMEEKRSREKEKEETKFEKTMHKLHLYKAYEKINSLMPERNVKPLKAKVKKEKSKKKSELEPKRGLEISKLFKKRPKDNLMYIYDLIAESYNAVSAEKPTIVDQNIKEIESLFPKIHTSERVEIKNDLKKLKKDRDALLEKMKIDMPLPPKKDEAKVKPAKSSEEVYVRPEQLIEDIDVKKERKPLFGGTKKSKLPKLEPLPPLDMPAEQPMPELEEAPIPPMPELGNLDLPAEPEEMRETEIPKSEFKKKFTLFTNKEEEKEEKIPEPESIPEPLPQSKTEPEFVPKIKEMDAKIEPLPEAPTPEKIMEELEKDIPETEEDIKITKQKIKKLPKLEQTEIEYHPEKVEETSEEQSESDGAQKQDVSDKAEAIVQDKPSEETLKAIKESEPIEYPSPEDINSLALGSIGKGDGQFRPKMILVPSRDDEIKIKLKEEKKPKDKPKQKLVKAKQVRTKPPIKEIEDDKNEEEIKEKIEDLENLIMTAQRMINLKNYSDAKVNYSRAMDIKKALKLKKSESKKIDYDLQGIDIDLKIAGMT